MQRGDTEENSYKVIYGKLQENNKKGIKVPSAF
jgi:hypothetical protein